MPYPPNQINYISTHYYYCRDMHKWSKKFTRDQPFGKYVSLLTIRGCANVYKNNLEKHSELFMVVTIDRKNLICGLIHPLKLQ